MPDGAPFGLRQIGQIAVNAHDLARAVAFYRDVLGMRFVFQAPGLALFECDGLRLLLSRPERPEFDHPASIIYYRVDDIAAAHRTLAARGVTFEGPPHVVHQEGDYELQLAAFRDSEGNTLALMQERPAPFESRH